MKRILVHEYGGPEVMRLEEMPTPAPGPGQALVRMGAIGVNFVEIYQRSGLYKVQLPFALGTEGAGTVEGVGPGVTEVTPGDRVAWLQGTGAYSTHTLIGSDKLVPLPPSLSFEQGAAVMVQGITAHILTHTTFPLQQGQTCLVHAAAGGVGLLLCQMAKRIGATVIGTTSTPEKARWAREAGADEVILYTEQDFEAEAKRITGGKGVTVVYDSVGKTTFDKSLASLAPLGYLVLFGQSSGFVPPFDVSRLAAGSQFVTRMVVFNYVAQRQKLLYHAGEVFQMVASGELRLRINRTFPLEQAAEAHRMLAARETSGKLLLVP